MPDQFVEVTSQSWFSRLGDSLKAVVAGIVMFILAFPLLFWNEGRAVRTAKSQKEGAKAVVSLSADQVNPTYEGRLIHLTGTPIADETLSDDQLGVTTKGMVLTRTVEMYQWQETKSSETKKKLGGGTETVTTYKYDTVWSAPSKDSAFFKDKSGHENPPKPYDSKKVTAKKVTLGAFQVPANLASRMGNPEPVAVDDKTVAAFPADLRARAHLAGAAIVVGDDPQKPRVGDLRITFTVTKPAPSTVVAMQSGNTFAGYQTRAGDKLLMVETGTKSAAEMFTEAEATNSAFTWFLRGVGFFVMFIGVLLVFRPLVTIGDVVPFIGSILGFGAGIIAFIVAIIFSTITIAISWIIFRPLVGILLLLVAGGGIFALVTLKKRRPGPVPAVT
jgi:Transmembrane protein 43